MSTPTHPRDRSTPFVCVDCGGPCHAYAGSLHGWTCRTCLDRKVFGDHPPEEPLPLLSDLPSHNSKRTGARDRDRTDRG